MKNFHHPASEMQHTSLQRERKSKLLPYTTTNQICSYQFSLNDNDVIHLPFILVLANQIHVLWFSQYSRASNFEDMLIRGQ